MNDRRTASMNSRIPFPKSKTVPSLLCKQGSLYSRSILPPVAEWTSDRTLRSQNSEMAIDFTKALLSEPSEIESYKKPGVGYNEQERTIFVLFSIGPDLEV